MAEREVDEEDRGCTCFPVKRRDQVAPTSYAAPKTHDETLVSKSNLHDVAATFLEETRAQKRRNGWILSEEDQKTLNFISKSFKQLSCRKFEGIRSRPWRPPQCKWCGEAAEAHPYLKTSYHSDAVSDDGDSDGRGQISNIKQSTDGASSHEPHSKRFRNLTTGVKASFRLENLAKGHKDKPTFRLIPCEHYGYFDFGGYAQISRDNRPKQLYVRVTPEVPHGEEDSSSDTDEEDAQDEAAGNSAQYLDKIWKLLTNDVREDHTHARTFPLVINVLDGCAHRDSWMEHLVKQIVKMQYGLGALVVTEGKHHPFTEQLGKSYFRKLVDHPDEESFNPTISCPLVGIRSWRELVRTPALSRKFSRKNTERPIRGRYTDEYEWHTLPETHHTHVVFIDQYVHDDRQKDKQSMREGKQAVDPVAETRMALANFARSQTAVVNILIGGDRKICESLRQVPEIPLIVVRGSGGLADRIADWNEDTSEIEEMLDFLEDHHKIHVLNAANLETTDLEREIFTALKSGAFRKRSRRFLAAMQWNHQGLIEDILRGERKIEPTGVIVRAITDAIKNNNAAQLQLFFGSREVQKKYKSEIKRVVSVETMTYLYKDLICGQTSNVAILLLRHKFLKDVQQMFARENPNKDNGAVSQLIRDDYSEVSSDGSDSDESAADVSDSDYENEADGGPIRHEENFTEIDDSLILHRVARMISRLLGEHFSLLYKPNGDMKPSDSVLQHSSLKDPASHIFIRFVLLNEIELALIVLRAVSSPMNCALVASALLTGMKEVAGNCKKTTLKQQLAESAELFERIATGTLRICQAEDNIKTWRMLVTDMTEWTANDNLITIANTAELKTFMEHDSCQDLLNRIWYNKLEIYGDYWKVFPLFAFLPLNIFIPRWIEHGDTGLDAEERYPLRKKLSHYYQAPFNKFLFTLITFFGFLGLFSYYVLADLRPFDSTRGLTAIEILLQLWVISLIMEEGFQIIRTKNDGPLNMRRSEIRQHFRTLTRVWFWYEILEFVLGYFVLMRIWYRLKEWIADGWNKWDALMICTFYVTFLLHRFLDVGDFGVVKIMYSFTILLFYIRLLRFLMVVEYIGPKIIMIREMVKDILYFILILIIFTAGFGIAYNVLLSPTITTSDSVNVTWKVAMDVFYRPYWQMYGELFLEDIDKDASENYLRSSVCNRNADFETGDPHRWTSCYAGWMVPIFVGAYMLITNVLLLNLLIAMFSYSFQIIQDESRRLWRFHFFNLVYEYQQMTILPPPLSLLYYVIVILLAIIYCIWYLLEKLFHNRFCATACRCCLRGRKRLRKRLMNFLETPLQTVTLKWSQEAERRINNPRHKSWHEECAHFQRQCAAKLNIQDIKDQRSTQLVRDYVSALEVKLVHSTFDLKGRINLLQDRTDDTVQNIRALQKQNTLSHSILNRTAWHVARLNSQSLRFIRCGQFTHLKWTSQDEFRSTGYGLFVGRESLNTRENYFEVEITDFCAQTEPEVGIGLVQEGYQSQDMPGWRIGSIAYHSDDGRLYNETGSSFMPKGEGAECRQGDVMGCRVLLSDKFDGRCDSIHHEQIKVVFTKNGQQVYEDTFVYKGSGLLPAVGIHTRDTAVRLLNYDVTSGGEDVSYSGQEAAKLVVDKHMEKGHSINLEVKRRDSVGCYDLTYSPEEKSGRPVGIFISKSTVTVRQSYFELKIGNQGSRRTIAIGLVNSSIPAGRQPGWDKGTVGYHADDGRLYLENGFGKGEKKMQCVQNDVMGCGVFFGSKVLFTMHGTPRKNQNLQIYFTKNGTLVHTCTFYYRGGGLIPAIGLHSKGEQVCLRGFVSPPGSAINFLKAKDSPVKRLPPETPYTSQETESPVQLPGMGDASQQIERPVQVSAVPNTTTGQGDDQRTVINLVGQMQLNMQRMMQDMADIKSDMQAMRKSQHKKFRSLESRISYTTE